MTYGEVADRLRETMIWLLERRRIIQLIGGPGTSSTPVTTTEAERAALGEEIQRYRSTVLTYCLEASRAVTPAANLDGDERKRYPSVAMRYQLELTHVSLVRDEQVSPLMGRAPHFELVRRWQTAARQAVEGEREIAVLRRQPLSREQQAQMLKDAADLVRGLVVLDVRYKNVPGWRFLEQRARLLNAATEVSSVTRSHLDPSIDGLGWRPTPGVIEGPALPGIAGVLQAQHNTLADLGHFPSAYNLRHLLVAQAELAQTAARFGRSVGSATAAAFDDRAGLYRQLVSASRTLGGEIGDGRFAALESANAARRIRSVVTPEPNGDDGLAHLVHMGTRIDARVSAAVEHGFREKLYFVAINLPTLGKTGPDGIVRAAQKYIPVDSPCQAELLALVRERLQPVHRVSGPDRDGVEDRRAALSAAVDRHMSTYVSSTR